MKLQKKKKNFMHSHNSRLKDFSKAGIEKCNIIIIAHLSNTIVRCGPHDFVAQYFGFIIITLGGDERFGEAARLNYVSQKFKFKTLAARHVIYGGKNGIKISSAY